MNVRDISIGELAERAGCTVQIIRHYEKIGLLPDTRRTSGNRRIYSEDQASRLIFIRHSRELGFSLDDIRQLLSFSNQPEQSCEQVDAIAREHLHGVQAMSGWWGQTRMSPPGSTRALECFGHGYAGR